MKKVEEEIKKSVQELRETVKQRTFSYIITALGLVAGLAWNEAIKSLIDNIFPLEKNSLLAKFIYAFGVTLIVILIIFYLEKRIKRNK